MDINDIYNFVDFWSKSGQQPGTPTIVNDTRDLFKETGKLVDNYVLGGTYQANMRGQDELLKQLLINAALMGAGAGVGRGVGKVATKLGPKITPELAALRNYLTKQQVVVHGTPTQVMGNKLIPYAGSELSPEAANIFSINPNRGLTDLNYDAVRDAMYYADTPFGSRGYFPKGMSKEEIANAISNQQPTIVIGRTPKSNLVEAIEPNQGVPQGIYTSSKPIDILKTITAKPSFKAQTGGKGFGGLKYDEVMQALKNAGIGSKTEKFLNKYPRK
jgi:hypothetical protein